MMNRYNYTDEQRKFIRDNYYEKTTKELLRMFNEKFGTNLTYQQMKKYKIYYGLSNGLDNSGWSKEQKEWIKNNYKGISNKDLCDKFNTTFGTNFKTRKFVDFKKNQGLHSDYTYNYREREDGEEVLYKNGYTYVKVGDKMISKGRYVYEKANGKIVDKHSILFLDGNKKNFKLENLICVNNKILARVIMNTSDDVELNESMIFHALLEKRIKDLKRNGEMLDD